MNTASNHDREIAAMFDRISPHYDLLNRILSFGTDRSWRRRTVALAVLGEGGLAIDVGAGTGDLTFALRKASADTARVIALDLSAGMLAVARKREPATRVVIASAEELPFPDSALDRIVTGFTVRNVGDLSRALREFRRVLRTDGRLIILELSHPPSRAFAKIYRLYFEQVAPRLATLFGGDAAAYSYLPRSLRRFPGAEDLAELIREAGFPSVRFERLTGGIAAIHVAE